MNEGQVQRRKRQIVPAWTKRRREQQHASFAGGGFDERGTAVFKTREHRCVLARLGTEVANHIRRRETPALLKHLEDWMIKLHFSNRHALAGLCLHRFTQRGRRDLLQRAIETIGRGLWASGYDHLPAVIDKPRERVGERA